MSASSRGRSGPTAAASPRGVANDACERVTGCPPDRWEVGDRRGQRVEEGVEVRGVGQARAVPGQERAHRRARQRRQDEHPVVGHGEHLRHGDRAGQGGVPLDQPARGRWRDHLEEQPPGRRRHLHHRAATGPVGAQPQPGPSARQAQPGQPPGHPGRGARPRQAGEGRVQRPAPQPDADDLAVGLALQHGRARRDPRAGGGRQHLAGGAALGPPDLGGVLHHRRAVGLQGGRGDAQAAQPAAGRVEHRRPDVARRLAQQQLEGRRPVVPQRRDRGRQQRGGHRTTLRPAGDDVVRDR
ncbi:hypothetical protein [Geodermatophilus obscurus]|uniref:LigA n=1 Tax=Geodermatophilus obscurus (strain ATCC 25078 / DSM 43160 / JCM 3152 / CCUG 61914 / KCC A-0152 / KCTC 9177 / NBRC 13315 / NRRL B-3577 / G-20) TaxID=526225 RepID=D2S4T9_GEOOG|nr:hypothetical protein [Geodermatophilus obscurus]ADB77239.1 LigA [Geodermatophilus obscurus DSM 43160]